MNNGKHEDKVYDSFFDNSNDKLIIVYLKVKHTNFFQQ